MITGVVLTRNEEANIVGCLEALGPHVAEIILIDMESSDRTVELARPMVSKILSHPRLTNFDGARNIAIPEARHEWLWFVDADERVPARTGEFVGELIRNRGHEFEALAIPFRSYCCGQWMRHCGWWPGYTGPRVLKRGHFEFAPNIHVGVRLDGRQLLVAPDPELAVAHYGIRNVEHYVEKVNRYSTAQAENLAQSGAAWNWRAALADMMREMWVSYEKNPGRLDGKRGWVVAWLSGQYQWLSRTKLLDFENAGGNGKESAEVPADLDEALDCMRDTLSRLRAKKPQPPFGVVWRAGIENESGYAEESRTMLKAFAQGDRPLVLDDASQGNLRSACVSSADRALFGALRRGRRSRHALAVAHGPAGAFVPDDRAAVNVLRTMIETDRLPAGWLERIEPFDEVWVPGQHVADAFRRSWVAPEKIRIVPGCLDTEVFSPEGDRLALPDELQGRFVFLSIFDWVPRKGCEVLLRSYCQEFRSDEPVGLLLKVTRVHGHSVEEIRGRVDSVLGQFGQSLAQRPDIVLRHEVLSDRQMAALYRAADAFVLASRGEGWGRPYMEAMACGLATIGTGASGNLEFMNKNNSLLIPASPMEVPEQAASEFPLFRGHRWFEPDAGELRRLMRQVFSHRGVRERLGRRAAEDMRRHFSLEAGGQAIETAVQAVEQRYVRRTAPRVEPHQIRVVLEGELFAGHSFSNINERLCLELSADPSLALSMRRVRHVPEQGLPHDAYRIAPFIDRELPGGPQVTIRHAYPPNWTPPEQGLWVHIQPWEYGHLPTAWLPALRDRVDEIWAPSNYVKRVYERSGVPGEKIQVIPWGVDPAVFTPEAVPLLLPTPKTFRFLYVGGTVARKGFDRLLDAYLAEFGPDEDVCLVVKDNGADTVYRFGNFRQQAIAAQNDPSGPAVLYLDRPMTPGQLASLYTACHCFVAPYRGEGFGLPILEAMACGIPPILPRGGASDDFVAEETGWSLESEETEGSCHEPLCGPLLELSISQEYLRQRMRKAFEEREQTRAKGSAAAVHVRDGLVWRETARRMVKRIRLLGNRNFTQTGVEAGKQALSCDLASESVPATLQLSPRSSRLPGAG